MNNQTDNLIYRAYKAIAEGISKQDEDRLLIDLELYVQQKELEEKSVQLTNNPQLN